MIVVEMCKNIPTTIASIMLKSKSATTNPEYIPNSNPTEVVNEKAINTNQAFLIEIFAGN